MWDKCSSIEKILVVLSAIFFISAIIILANFENIFKRKFVHPDDKIAEVIKVDQQVKRRMPMSFEFDNLEEGQPIGNGDSIFSGDNSQIMVKFLKGSQLVIGEQSLVVLREVDGKIDMKIEKGGISGALSESDEIEIKAEDDSVTINGEKDAQFSVSYKPGLGMEIVSYEKNLNVKYRGDEIKMKNKRAVVSNKKGIEIQKKLSDSNAKDTEMASTTPEDNMDLEPPKMPKGVGVEELSIKSKPIALAAPFPEQNQVFLHNKGGQIPIYPKEQCMEGCSLDLKINGAMALKKNFAKNSVPLVFLVIEAKIEAEIVWILTDGETITTGKFEVKKNNEANFSKALTNRQPAEVMN